MYVQKRVSSSCSRLLGPWLQLLCLLLAAAASLSRLTDHRSLLHQAMAHSSYHTDISLAGFGPFLPLSTAHRG